MHIYSPFIITPLVFKLYLDVLILVISALQPFKLKISTLRTATYNL